MATSPVDWSEIFSVTAPNLFSEINTMKICMEITK